MRSIRIPVILAAVAAILAACGGVSQQGGGGASAGPPSASYSRENGASAPSGQKAQADAISKAQGDRQIIQDATIDLRIQSGTFDDVYSKALAVAQRWDGYLLSSHAGNPTQDSIQSGTLVVRVPAKNYADALQAFRGLGTATQIQVTSQDVSEEFVDLRARLRNQQAQQAFLLDLMRRAQTIQDSINVQNQLSQVTQEIERISGRLRFLETRTDFSTITLNLFVVAPPAAKAHQPSLWEQSGIADAVKTAARMSANVVGGMIIVLGFVLPFALLVALGVGAWRLLPRKLLPTLR